MLVTIIISSIAIVQRPKVQAGINPVFSIVAKTNHGGIRPDYLNFLKSYLSRIGIEVKVETLDWPKFILELLYNRDYDMCFVAFSGGGGDPDFTGVYNENGSLNLFSYHTSLDWNETLGTGTNEWYINQGLQIMPPNSQERVQHYWAWEQYLMDKILPCIPAFTHSIREAHWSNLQGYNFSEGISQSWGKMSFDGIHKGQVSTSELVVNGMPLGDLNPITQSDSYSSFISRLTMDPLVWIDSDQTIRPHLAKNWEVVNNSCVRFSLREGIRWQVDPEGIFTDEYFDAEDVYFTINALKLFSDQEQLQEIKSMNILDKYTVEIIIDGNRATSENEPYAPFLSNLNLPILPEHYLNQTQELDGITPDTTHPSWSKFSKHCFGTGILELFVVNEEQETILTRFDNCWRMNETLTSDPNLSWVERFGSRWELEQIRIRVIPPASLIQEFESGGIDTLGISQYPDKVLEYLSDSTKNIQSYSSYYFSFFGFNLKETREHIGSRDPCPNDPAVSKGLAIRKAIAYAINMEEINKVVHSKGQYKITHHPIYERLGIWCNPNIIQYNYDLDKAREYMAKAGYNLNIEEQNKANIQSLDSFGVKIAITVLAFGGLIQIIKKKKLKGNRK